MNNIDQASSLDVVKIVRQRLADGRTIADADVCFLVKEIDRLRLKLEINNCVTSSEAERRRQYQIEAVLKAMIHRRVVSENLREYERAQLIGLYAALTEVQNLTLPVDP